MICSRPIKPSVALKINITPQREQFSDAPTGGRDTHQPDSLWDSFNVSESLFFLGFDSNFHFFFCCWIKLFTNLNETTNEAWAAHRQMWKSLDPKMRRIVILIRGFYFCLAALVVARFVNHVTGFLKDNCQPLKSTWHCDTKSGASISPLWPNVWHI